MNALIRWSACGLAALACLSSSVVAESLPMDKATIERLDIAMARPESATSGGGVTYPAVVSIPPEQERRVGFTESVRVLSMSVVAGDSVEQGQPLAQVTSAQLLALQRDYLQAHLDLVLARQQYTRDKALEADGIIALRQLEESRNLLGNKRISVAQQASMLKLNGFSDADIQTLSNSGKLQTEVTLRAPISGVVMEVPAALGETLDMGESVVKLADLSQLWLNIRVPLNTVKTIKTGAPVSIPSYGVQASVDRISRQVDTVSQTVVVRAVVTEGVEHLRPGEAIEVRLAETTDPLLSLPRAAVIHNEGRNWVFVRTTDGFEVTAVALAGYKGESALIRSGLDADSEVAVRGIAALKGALIGIGGGE